jgi:DNA-binding transcriptional LysR family regulator
VENGSFSAAARKLLRVQSAVSQSIKALEDQLSIQLFDRTGRLPVLTDSGRAIYEHAVEVLSAVDDLRARAASSAAGLEPEISVAIDQMLPTALVMESLNAFAAEFPTLPVSLYTEALPGACERWLREGVVRASVHSMFGDNTDGLDAELLVSIAILPVVSTSHPLASHEGMISSDELNRHLQLILTDRSRVVHSVAGGAASSKKVWRFADQYTRLEYLLAGFGWSHLPLHMAAPHIQAGRLRFLELNYYGGGYITIPLHVVTLKNQTPGTALRYLLSDLRGRLATMPSVSDIVGRTVPDVRVFVRAARGNSNALHLPPF